MTALPAMSHKNNHSSEPRLGNVLAGAIIDPVQVARCILEESLSGLLNKQ